MESVKARIRVAGFGDIPAVSEMIAEGHARSRYAGIPLHQKRVNQVIANALQRHGGTVEGSTFFAVAERGGEIEGFIIGLLMPLYHVVAALEATDLFWYARPTAHPATGAGLMRAMHKWAAKSPHVRYIRQGNTDAIVDSTASGRLIERAGLRRVGAIYEREIRA